ncbi:CRISPR-associated endonuclease Cas1 [Cutibacterium avidum]|uniref:CRISPR-associated endonuclease Cas1 n=1 Tax=Cutibacterium avidum TaxID=33010 RepID=UPI0030807085
MGKSIPGARPAEVQELARAQDRLSFIYMEHCIVNRDSNAITASNQQGTVHVPASMIGALLLGPGTNVTHQAMVLLAESGATTLWVGEHGVRYYAHGRPLARTTRLLDLQAEAVTDHTKRLAVARRMYEMRFPDDVATGPSSAGVSGHGRQVRRRLGQAQLQSRGLRVVRPDEPGAHCRDDLPLRSRALRHRGTRTVGRIGIRAHGQGPILRLRRRRSVQDVAGGTSRVRMCSERGR